MNQKTNSGSLGANFILACATLLFCLLLVEGFLRLGHTLTRGPGEEKLYEYDSVLGWKTKANLNTTVPGEGRRIPFTTNAKGFRGKEISYEKTPGTRRVLILGKSFAQAVQVREEELFSEKLTNLLGEAGGAPWEVINTGTAGYCTDQQLLFMKSEGSKYQPDLTILMFHDNDVWYNNHDYFFEKAKPRYELSGGNLRLTRVPVPKESTLDSRVPKGGGTSGFFESAKAWFARNSFVYRLVRKKVRENPALFEAAARLGVSGKNVQDVPDDFRVWRRERDKDIDDAWKITEALILEIRREVEAGGSKFAVFYVPNRTAVAHEHWTATRVRYGWDEKGWNANQVADDLKVLCATHHIALMDPTEDFIRTSRQSPSPGPLYYAIDSHWTPKGHEVTAETMADWILSQADFKGES